LIVMPFVLAQGSSESLNPCDWSPPKPNMISTVVLAVPPLLPPELLVPELRHPLVSSVTAPAVATALVKVVSRMSSLLIVEPPGVIRAEPAFRGRLASAGMAPSTRFFDVTFLSNHRSVNPRQPPGPELLSIRCKEPT